MDNLDLLIEIRNWYDFHGTRTDFPIDKVKDAIANGRRKPYDSDSFGQSRPYARDRRHVEVPLTEIWP